MYKTPKRKYGEPGDVAVRPGHDAEVEAPISVAAPCSDNGTFSGNFHNRRKARKHQTILLLQIKKMRTTMAII